MFKIGDRVQHISDQSYKLYGVMEIWEIKNNFAVCRYGDFHNLSIATFPLTELRLSDK